MAEKIKLSLKKPSIESIVDENNSKAYIIRNWITSTNAKKLFDTCSNLPTKLYDFRWYGRPLKQKRLNWLCGDDCIADHSFAGQSVPANKWNDDFKEIRDKLNTDLDVYTNGCLVNHYPDGSYSIALHSDSELFAKNKSVFTLSLGATRTFQFERKSDGYLVEVPINQGDLIVFCGNLQNIWRHGVKADPHITECRYSLTFRGMNTKK